MAFAARQNEEQPSTPDIGFAVRTLLVYISGQASCRAPRVSSGGEIDGRLTLE